MNKVISVLLCSLHELLTCIKKVPSLQDPTSDTGHEVVPTAFTKEKAEEAIFFPVMRKLKEN